MIFLISLETFFGLSEILKTGRVLFIFKSESLASVEKEIFSSSNLFTILFAPIFSFALKLLFLKKILSSFDFPTFFGSR